MLRVAYSHEVILKAHVMKDSFSKVLCSQHHVFLSLFFCLVGFAVFNAPNPCLFIVLLKWLHWFIKAF